MKYAGSSNNSFIDFSIKIKNSKLIFQNFIQENLINIKSLNGKLINKRLKNILNVYSFHIDDARHHRSIYNESISKDWWNI